MSHAVIPAPVRFDVGGGREFVFRPGTAVGYADSVVAPIVERFCSQITRRTGLRLAPMPGGPAPGEPSVTIELAAGGELGALPAPAGVSPAGQGVTDERYSLVIEAGQVVVRAVEPAGVARGLTTLIQLAAMTPPSGAGEIRLPGARILDAPRYAWRGLSLDVARTFFTVGEIRRVIDLLALYKLNVLHLHLTDDQSWRLPMGRSAGRPESGAAFYSGDDLAALVAYAADRLVVLAAAIATDPKPIGATW
jgi:hexosaminidase